MCDMFSREDARKLLHNKKVLFLGDSNVRAMYKDLVWLLQNHSLITSAALKRKLEPSFLGDTLKRGATLHCGRSYEEVRDFQIDNILVSFCFITRCYTDEIKSMLHDIKAEPKSAPDVLIINSCLWDISRWGPNGVSEYKDNLVKLMKLLQTCLPKKSLVIWTTVPPISSKARGGLLVPQVEFMQHTLRFEVMEANQFAREVVVPHGFDVLDIHYYLRMQIMGRASDGIHWLPVPVRHMTNLLLTHISVSWNCTLPGRLKGQSLERFKQLVHVPDDAAVNLPKVPSVAAKVKASSKPVASTFQKVKNASKVPASPLRQAIKAKLQKKKPLPIDENEEIDILNESGFDTSFACTSEFWRDPCDALPCNENSTFYSDPNLQFMNDFLQPYLEPMAFSHFSAYDMPPYCYNNYYPNQIDVYGPVRQKQSRQRNRRWRRHNPYNYRV